MAKAIIFLFALVFILIFLHRIIILLVYHYINIFIVEILGIYLRVLCIQQRTSDNKKTKEGKSPNS
jgi:hypothetical protein